MSSRHFSLQTALRMIPNELLRQFLEQFPYPCYSLDWERLGERQWQAIVDTLKLWPENARLAVEAILLNVFELACDTGIRAIREAANRLESRGILKYLDRGVQPYRVAMWTWLESSDVFDQALLSHQIEALRWWRRRDDLPAVEPETDPEALELLGSSVSEFLVRTESRGERCTVEHFRRDDGTDYFTCYPDDYVRTVLLHDDDGTLSSRTIRQTFEIVFAYHREAGTLELCAEVPTQLKPRLEELFGWHILGESIGPRQMRNVFHLDSLKERQFNLETDPEDEVHVALRNLRLDLPDHSRRIVLESRRGPAHDVLQMVDECLNEENVALDDVSISLATFRFQFGRGSGRRAGTMTFDVAHPNTCNLHSQRPERVRLARKYLRRWRISRSA